MRYVVTSCDSKISTQDMCTLLKQQLNGTIKLVSGGEIKNGEMYTTIHFNGDMIDTIVLLNNLLLQDIVKRYTVSKG